MARLSLHGIGKRFANLPVLRNVDLDIADRELVVFVGPSGCGKSTLLRVIAGLEAASEGTITLNGRRIDGVAPSKRGIAMVFQSYALYPHMDVRQNMAFGIKLAGLPAAEIEARIGEAARILKLEALLDRRPRELSGGQRQRVAIGRALVRKPEIFLLDEPLSNLDAALRSEVRLEIARLHRTIGGTMIYVTHDQVEAMTLADRIVVMNEGRIEQVGSPRELYERPANTFVATFIGSPKMALAAVTREGDSLGIAGGGAIRLERMPQGRELTLGLRPDALNVLPRGEDGLAGRVVYSEYLGDDAFVYVRLADGTQVAVRVAPDIAYEPDAVVNLGVSPQGAHFFDRQTGLRLS